MSRHTSSKEKIQAVKEYLDGKLSINAIAKKYDVDHGSFRQWLIKYQAKGTDAFIRTGHNSSYSVEFKQKVIDSWLAGEVSFLELAKKYKMSGIACWCLGYESTDAKTILDKYK
jgi:transposase